MIFVFLLFILAWGNEIRDEGAIILFKALKNNAVIRELILSTLKIHIGDTMIQDKGAIAIGDYLGATLSLENLNLCIKNIKFRRKRDCGQRRRENC